MITNYLIEFSYRPRPVPGRKIRREVIITYPDSDKIKRLAQYIRSGRQIDLHGLNEIFDETPLQDLDAIIKFLQQVLCWKNLRVLGSRSKVPHCLTIISK